MGDYPRKESIFGFSGPVARIVGAAIGIPLGARLFAVIDVYDALTTDRANLTARSHTDALAKIREESGTHFDSAVVADFAKIPFEELREIAKKNQTPLLFASPPVPSLRHVTSVLSPGS